MFQSLNVIKVAARRELLAFDRVIANQLSRFPIPVLLFRNLTRKRLRNRDLVKAVRERPEFPSQNSNETVSRVSIITLRKKYNKKNIFLNIYI